MSTKTIDREVELADNSQAISFEQALEWLNKLSDSTCLAIGTVCEIITDTTRFACKCLFVMALFSAISVWRHGPYEEPQMLLVACCLGILAANLAEVALGKRDLSCTIRKPIVLALITYYMPIGAISEAIQAF